MHQIAMAAQATPSARDATMSARLGLGSSVTSAKLA